ncbi:MAG: class I mannose-6-phosphate isomerase [Flavobacteriia bacterium]|nr:class I mannose-6-phosphate isomerase [Flavobacteriia bacterium]
MNLYPLKFTPILQERIWGGEKLQTSLHKDGSIPGIGESWEVSGVPGHLSKVSNGPLKGTNLQELIDQYGAALLGKKVFRLFGAAFPILIKFLDAAQDLSIQVHPDDSLAEKRHGSKGKNEMWYVMEAAQDATLIVGFKEGIDQQRYQAALEKDALLSILDRHEVAQGDAFFIEAGTIHAIGAGILLAEIQQTSDVTYRVYDFNRKDKYGHKRPLHTQEALAALNYSHSKSYKRAYVSKNNQPTPIVKSPFFTTKHLPVQGSYRSIIDPSDSFKILICVKGSAQVSTNFGEENISYGETILLAASSGPYEIISHDSALFLEVSLEE